MYTLFTFLILFWEARTSLPADMSLPDNSLFSQTTPFPTTISSVFASPIHTQLTNNTGWCEIKEGLYCFSSQCLLTNEYSELGFNIFLVLCIHQYVFFIYTIFHFVLLARFKKLVHFVKNPSDFYRFQKINKNQWKNQFKKPVVIVRVQYII